MANGQQYINSILGTHVFNTLFEPFFLLNRLHTQWLYPFVGSHHSGSENFMKGCAKKIIFVRLDISDPFSTYHIFNLWSAYEDMTAMCWRALWHYYNILSLYLHISKLWLRLSQKNDWLRELPMNWQFTVRLGNSITLLLYSASTEGIMHPARCTGKVLGSRPESEDISLASHIHNLQMHS